MSKIEKNAALLGLGAFLLLMFSVVVTVALPLMQADLYVADASAPRYSGLDNDGQEISDKVAQGRGIYMREGCWYCHTQQVRTIDNDKAFRAPAATLSDGTQVGDRPTRPSDYAYDNPALLGTERTGPDLKYVAHRWPSKEWQIGHLIDPRGYTPGSIMPSYGHLPEHELDALAEYLLSLRDWAIPIKSLAKYPGKDILNAGDELLPDEYKNLQNPFKVGDPTAKAMAEKLIKEKGCLGCHGVDMKGKNPSNGWTNAPYPTDWFASAEKHSEAFIYWIISEGSLKEDGTKSGMPAWRTMGLTDEERWALTTYIKGLKN